MKRGALRSKKEEEVLEEGVGPVCGGEKDKEEEEGENVLGENLGLKKDDRDDAWRREE